METKPTRLEQLFREEQIRNDYRQIIVMCVIGMFATFLGGICMGSCGAEEHALKREHCEQAGGTLQADGGCSKVIITPVTPAP